MRQKFNILKLIGKKTNNDKTVLRMVERWITKHGRHEWLENLLGIDIPRTVDLQIRRHTRKVVGVNLCSL